MTIHFNVRQNEKKEYKLSGFFYDEKDVEEIVDFFTNLQKKVRISIDYNRESCFLWVGAIMLTIYDDISLTLFKLATNVRITDLRSR